MNQGLQTRSLLRLMDWLSPAFPIGGFAYSGGLERAVADCLVTDAAGLGDWLAAVMRHGALWNDAVLFGEASRQFESEGALKEVADLGLAMAGSAERYSETLSLGKGFVAAASAWPSQVLDRLPKDVPFPVAVGSVSAAHGIRCHDALAAWLHAAVSQSVSAGIRLGVCGQTEGVDILACTETLIGEIAERAAGSTLDDLGGMTVQAEIASLRHETQHSRLFRS